jgi:UDP-glucose 4-epimerase
VPKSKNNICVVLGGCGFLGSVVTRHLVTQGLNVRVFDKEGQDTYRIKPVLKKVDLQFGDFSNLGDLTRALEGSSTVLHFIGTTIPQTSMNDIKYDVETNVLPTVRLLEQLKERPSTRIIFASSGGTVYGKSEPGQTLSENSPTEPISAYGISKLMIEKFIKLFSFNYGLPHVILRFSNPYGPSQHPLRPQGAVSVFLNKALNGEEIAIWGNGTVVRDYIYEDDLAAAVCSVVKKTSLQGVFNVGTGDGTSLNQIVKLIQTTFAVECRVAYKRERKFDVPYNVLDIRKIQGETGWNPTCTLVEGLKKMKHFKALSS